MTEQRGRSEYWRELGGGPKERGSEVTAVLIVFYSQFFTCSSSHVDQCSNPLGIPSRPKRLLRVKQQQRDMKVGPDGATPAVAAHGHGHHSVVEEHKYIYIYIYIYI